MTVVMIRTTMSSQLDLITIMIVMQEHSFLLKQNFYIMQSQPKQRKYLNHLQSCSQAPTLWNVNNEVVQAWIKYQALHSINIRVPGEPGNEAKPLACLQSASTGQGSSLILRLRTKNHKRHESCVRLSGYIVQLAGSIPLQQIKISPGSHWYYVIFEDYNYTVHIN